MANETMGLFDELKNELESAGLKVNILQSRPTILEHLADVKVTGVWFLGIACPCTWRLAVVCDAFLFSTVPVHGKSTGTDSEKNCLAHFGKVFL